MTVALQPLVALIAGIRSCSCRDCSNYIVAIYLILVGIFGIWPGLMHGAG